MARRPAAAAPAYLTGSMPLPSPLPCLPVMPFAMPPLLVPWPKSAVMTGGLFRPKPCMNVTPKGFRPMIYAVWSAANSARASSR